jgi:DNA-directed RNA polymerase specialized sigma24 family protein
MTTEAQELQRETNRLLKVLIALEVRRSAADGSKTLKQQIAMLSEMKLRPVEIAEILGRAVGHVNKELSGIRKTKGKEQ